LVDELRERGFDALHVREFGLASASDLVILAKAVEERRIVVSRDGDFSALLAHSNLAWPSFVHLRTPRLNHPLQQAEVLCRVLVASADDLLNGAIVTIRGERARVRKLPVR
jgi:predicted nuclease of predicted toxin-antitoxin system